MRSACFPCAPIQLCLAASGWPSAFIDQWPLVLFDSLTTTLKMSWIFGQSLRYGRRPLSRPPPDILPLASQMDFAAIMQPSQKLLSQEIASSQ
jgi:hypothetical protein